MFNIWSKGAGNRFNYIEWDHRKDSILRYQCKCQPAKQCACFENISELSWFILKMYDINVIAVTRNLVTGMCIMFVSVTEHNTDLLSNLQHIPDSNCCPWGLDVVCGLRGIQCHPVMFALCQHKPLLLMPSWLCGRWLMKQISSYQAGCKLFNYASWNLLISCFSSLASSVESVCAWEA